MDAEEEAVEASVAEEAVVAAVIEAVAVSVASSQILNPSLVRIRQNWCCGSIDSPFEVEIREKLFRPQF